MGGYETLVSFGIDAETADHGTLDDLCALIAERVPAEAIDFLDRGENLVLLGDYLFVHAGIRPGKPLDQQAGADLRWIREPFLSARRRDPWMVVQGHTPADAVDHGPQRIGIDTGALASRLEKRRVGQEGVENV